VASPQLAAAIAALAIRSLDRDSTLEDLRLALEGTGFRWSSAGDLTCSGERMALVDELDALIEAFGGCAPAARLFPDLARVPTDWREREPLVA
jgi:hypothetical protein